MLSLKVNKSIIYITRFTIFILKQQLLWPL
jgi:hypothetical protein